jgi:SNF2 family DNA or RNA helicase
MEVKSLTVDSGTTELGIEWNWTNKFPDIVFVKRTVTSANLKFVRGIREDSKQDAYIVHVTLLPVITGMIGKINVNYWNQKPNLPVIMPLRKPYRHQVITADAVMLYSSFSVLSEQGTGKTQSVVDAMAALIGVNRVERVLVVCKNYAMGTWLREIEAASRMSAVILDATNRKSKFEVALKNNIAFIIVNYEAMSTDFYNILWPYINNRWTLVCDESTALKNPKAERTKRMMALAHRFGRRITITGTPIIERPLDIYCQWYIVDLGQAFGFPQNINKPAGGYYTFRRNFFYSNPYNQWEFKPLPGTIDYIRNAMQHRSIRFEKKDCLDLPPKVFVTINVEMENKQKLIYNQAAEQMLVEIGETNINIPTTIAKLMKLRQICDGFIYAPVGDSCIIEGNNPKLSACRAIVDECAGKVVIWCAFRETMRMLAKEFANDGCVVFDGNDETIKEFQTGTAKIFIGNPQSGGQSITLTAANTVIYYSRDWSGELRLQSEDRTHRIGTTGDKVTYYDILCKNSVDVTMLTVLREKKDLATSITHDLRKVIEGTL